jgi:hypothetical protein
VEKCTVNEDLFGLANGAIGMPRRNSMMSFINPMVTVNSLTEEGSLAGILSSFAKGSREEGPGKLKPLASESEGVEGVMRFGVRRLSRSGAIPPVIVVIVFVGRPRTAFVKKDHCLMGRDFKALLTGLAGHVIIHSDEVIS